MSKRSENVKVDPMVVSTFICICTAPFSNILHPYHLHHESNIMILLSLGRPLLSFGLLFVYTCYNNSILNQLTYTKWVNISKYDRCQMFPISQTRGFV